MQTIRILGAVPAILLALCSSTSAAPTASPPTTNTTTYDFRLRIHTAKSGAPFDNYLLTTINNTALDYDQITVYNIGPVANTSEVFHLADGLLEFNRADAEFRSAQEPAFNAPIELLEYADGYHPGYYQEPPLTGPYEINLANNRLGLSAERFDSQPGGGGDGHWAICYGAQGVDYDGPLLWFAASKANHQFKNDNCTKIFIKTECI